MSRPNIQLNVLKTNNEHNLDWWEDFNGTNFIVKKDLHDNSKLNNKMELKYWTYECKEMVINEVTKMVEIIKLKQKNKKNILSNEFVELFFDLLVSLLSDKKDLFSVLKECEMIFEKQSRTLKESLLIGMLGELSFLYEMSEINKDIINWFHSNEYMKFDLYAKEFNYYIEIKTTLTNDQKFTLKYDQLSEDKNIFLATVSLIHDDNGVDITYFIDKFLTTNSESLNNFVGDIGMLVEEYPNIKKIKINLNKIGINFFNVKDLPLPKIDYDPTIISEISFKANFDSVNHIDKNDFFTNIKK